MRKMIIALLLVLAVLANMFAPATALNGRDPGVSFQASGFGYCYAEQSVALYTRTLSLGGSDPVTYAEAFSAGSILCFATQVEADTAGAEWLASQQPAPPVAQPPAQQPVAQQPAKPAVVAQTQTWQLPTWLTVSVPGWFNQSRPASNWAALNNCPMPWSNIGASAILTATLEDPDLVMHLNVSRFEPANVAGAGPMHESNVLVGLAAGVEKVEIAWDGSGSYYPEEITRSVNGCHLSVNTMGGNWPTSLTGVPSGIFQYYTPYGVIEQPVGWPRYPDKVYGVRWTDAEGEHVWVNRYIVDRVTTIPAELWWLDQQRDIPVVVTSTTTRPTATPTVMPVFDPACAPNAVIANGDNMTATGCGWMKLTFWTSGVPEKMYLFYSDQPVVVSGWSGSFSSWDHVPNMSDVGTLPVATKNDVTAAGITIAGSYEVFTVP